MKCKTNEFRASERAGSDRDRSDDPLIFHNTKREATKIARTPMGDRDTGDFRCVSDWY